MSKSETKSQDGPRPEQDKAEEHITKAESFCQAAEFDEALKEIGKARERYPELENISQVESDINSTAEKYKAEISAVREALSKKEFSEASSACERASKLCPQAEVTKSLEHKIKLEQAVQSGSKKREQAERGRRRMLAAIKAIGIGALVVVIVVVLFVSVSYIKDISWESKKEHHVIVPKTFAKSNSKKRGLGLWLEKRKVTSLISQANIFRSKGQFDKSLECVVKALSLSPDNIEAKQMQIELNMAKAKANDNKKNGKIALKVLDEVLRIQPSHREAKQLYGKISAYYISKDPMWWLNKAKTSIKKMKYEYNRNLAYMRIIQLQLKMNDIAGAEKTTLNLTDKLFNKERVYLDIIKTKAEAGNISGAKNDISKVFSKWSAYEIIAKAQAKIGDKSGARKTLREAEKEVTKKRFTSSRKQHENLMHKTSAYCDIAKEQFRVEDVYGAKGTIMKAESLAESMGTDIYESKSKAMAYVAVVKAKVALGDITGVLSTLRKANNAADSHKGLRRVAECYLEKADAYKAIAEEYASVENRTKARELLSKAAKIINSIDSNFRGGARDWRSDAAKAYVAIAKEQAKVGDYAGVEITAKYIDNIPLYSSSEDKIARAWIAKVQADAGDVAVAKATAAKLGRINESEVYLYIVKTQIRRSDLTHAKETAAIIDESYDYKVKAYIAIGHAQSEVGDIDAAKKIFKEAKEMVKTLRDSQSQAYCYSDIAVAEAQLDEIQTSIETFEMAVASATKMKNKTLKPWTYHYIARCQLEVGQVAGAENTAIKINDDRQRVSICETIAKTYAKTSELVKLQQWIESLQGDKERIYSYVGAAEGLIEKEEH